MVTLSPPPAGPKAWLVGVMAKLHVARSRVIELGAAGHVTRRVRPNCGLRAQLPPPASHLLDDQHQWQADRDHEDERLLDHRCASRRGRHLARVNRSAAR
jgi:hypothetical protein